MLFRLPSRITIIFGETLLAMVWSVGGILAGLGFFWFGAWGYGAALAALGLVLAVLSLSPTLVTLGADGVAVRWLGYNRFIPYGELVAISPHVEYGNTRGIRGPEPVKSMGVRMRFANDKTMYLVCSAKEIRDLVAITNDRLLAHKKQAPMDVFVLRRGERSIAEWLASLRRLLEGGGYRGNATTPDALWAVVENPKSEADDRAAAALALRAHLGEEARPRLRVAIEACASPKLRVALESIEHEDEAETEKSLGQISARSTPE